VDLGFTAFRHMVAKQTPSAAALLRATYVRLQYERLMGESEDESAMI
jgi:hypothetical protein